MLEVFAYNAGKGDCIRIHYAGTHNIIIDSGVMRFSQNFKRICDSVIQERETLDALILTLVDTDHIGGILTNLRRANYKCPFNEVWMNHSGKASFGDRTLSVQQNDEVYARLLNRGINVKPMYKDIRNELAGAKICVFWPDKNILEDYDDCCVERNLARHADYGLSLSDLANKPLPIQDASSNNKKSVVFSFEFENRKLLFTGDAWAENVISAQGVYDLVKISHHGSARNISELYRDSIHASNFLICTDGVSHPDKQTIAKLEKWYGKIDIYSPSEWWKNGYFIKDDYLHKISYHYREGCAIIW